MVMWKAVFPVTAALLALSVSLASGEGARRGADQEEQQPQTRSTVAAGTAKSTRAVALVIGNAAYPDAELKLTHPVNNARALADALREKGFEVISGENLGKQEMHRAIETFTEKVTPGSAALVFFSGFGIQASRKTYLIPVNAQIWVEDDVRRGGVSVEPILGELDSRGAGAKLIILDASRRNPFERRFRGFSAGLAGIYSPDDTLVMYSAAPGKVVNDDGGEQSPLISELIAQIRAPGQSAEDIFNRTRLSVSQASQRKQVPWVSSSMIDRFFFGSSETTARPNPR
jgi:uncharacterized caspase-like protein